MLLYYCSTVVAAEFFDSNVPTFFQLGSNKAKSAITAWNATFAAANFGHTEKLAAPATNTRPIFLDTSFVHSDSTRASHDFGFHFSRSQPVTTATGVEVEPQVGTDAEMPDVSHLLAEVPAETWPEDFAADLPTDLYCRSPDLPIDQYLAANLPIDQYFVANLGADLLNEWW